MNAPVIPTYGWHLLLCADQTKPKCCDKPCGLDAWNYLKKRLKTLNLETGDRRVFRTKANCLRGCDYRIPGPVLLVYPGGYWYHSVTPEVVERVLQEHVIGGQPVTDFLVTQTPWPPVPQQHNATPQPPSPSSVDAEMSPTPNMVPSASVLPTEAAPSLDVVPSSTNAPLSDTTATPTPPQ